MENQIESIEYKKHYIKTFVDVDSEDPRIWDNISKICIRKHRHYTFPNELSYSFDSESENQEDQDINKKYYIFYLDMYEHGAIVFSFSGEGIQCRFDTSNNIGFIAVPKGEDPLTGHITNNQEEAYKIAKSELQTYNEYLNGDVYGYIIEGKYSDDSCWGYFGSDGYEDMIQDAKQNIESGIEYAVNKHIKQVKAWIVNKVPLIYRKSLDI